ncbi:Swarming motility protein YbiA [Marinibacterium anthonyi]|nr:Swarming motility protein YbiA [Marinibacterium anthonyi]
MDHVRFYDPRQGRWCGLSNLHPVAITFEGVPYATPEHAFQARRARSPEVSAWLAAAPTPELCAVAGDALAPEDVAKDWDATQLPLMAGILAAKFSQDPFRDLLLSTGEAYLVEWAPEDSPVNRFWGEYQGQGDNHLGRMLMDLRARLRAGQPSR